MYRNRDRENQASRRRSASPPPRNHLASRGVRDSDYQQLHSPVPRRLSPYSPTFPSPSSPSFLNYNRQHTYSDQDSSESNGPGEVSDPSPSPAPNPSQAKRARRDSSLPPPPPYSARDAPLVQPTWPGLGLPLRGQPTSTSDVKFEIPLESDIIGQQPMLSAMFMPPSTPFDIGLRKLCVRMSLDLSSAVLAFRLMPGARVRDPPRALASANDWQDMITSYLAKRKGARSQEVNVAVRIINMCAPTIAAGSRQGQSRKSKAAKPEDKLVGVREFRLLKEHLACSKHPGRYCFVRKDGSHLDTKLEIINLWAEEIAAGRASIETPPHNIVFQDFFLGGDTLQKAQPRQKLPQSLPPQTVNVTHYHFPRPASDFDQADDSSFDPYLGQPTPNSSAATSSSGPYGFPFDTKSVNEMQPMASSSSQAFQPELSHANHSDWFPLSEKAGMNYYNTEGATNEPWSIGAEDPLSFLEYDSSPPIAYPETIVALRRMADEFPFKKIDIPAMFVELCAYNLRFVDLVCFVDRDFFVKVIGIPHYFVDDFIRISREITAEAESASRKGKGRA